MTKTTPLLFEDKPVFGLDIGHGSLHVLQLDLKHAKPRIIGYGTASFDATAIKDGIIVKPEAIAAAVQELFKKNLVGDITTARVAMTLPVARAFTRSMQVPILDDTELAEAVRTEVEQYIPVPMNELNVDYTKLHRTEDGMSLFLVAMPKTIVNSYLDLGQLLGLETIILETSIGACAQLFSKDPQSDVPSLLVDFGSESADITVYDGGLSVSGTVACGGEQITYHISNGMNVTMAEAVTIKTKYGLSFSKKQNQIETALTPLLNQLIKEIRRTIRYHEERSPDSTISQVVIMGGGANMPGLADYLTSNLRLAVRAADPGAYIDFGRMQPFSSSERMSFVTVSGLGMINPTGVFA